MQGMSGGMGGGKKPRRVKGGGFKFSGRKPFSFPGSRKIPNLLGSKMGGMGGM